jgi:hypothetical protein
MWKMQYALDLQVCQALKKLCFKYLHKYMEIWNKKKSSANVNGDGLLSEYVAQQLRLDRLKNLNSIAIERNYKNIAKLRGKAHSNRV